MRTRSGWTVTACLGTAAALAALLWAPRPVHAQQAGTTRTDLQRHDLSAAGREAIQARADFEPGVTFPRHRHPGEELVYVLEGTIEYRLDGREPVTLRKGDVLFIPARTYHSARNVGSGRSTELATYVLEKGQPPLELAR